MILFAATSLRGAETSEILGSWKTEAGDSTVEIYSCGAKLCGKIVWLRQPLYADGEEGIAGTPIIDLNNPDPALRSRPVLGLQVLDGFTREEEKTWANGKCYDPESGKTYRGKIYLVSPNRLELRGYVGITLFGRTAVWTR